MIHTKDGSMLLPKFDYSEPATIKEACQMMTEYGATAKLLAGGTDLMVDMKKRLVSPRQVVSISRIKVLKKIDRCSDTIRIGSCATIADLVASDLIVGTWSALRAGAKAIGSPQVRHRATIGGNIVSASPAADLPPSLIAYGARLVLKKTTGERMIPLEDFFLGSRKTKIEPDEVLTEIRIAAPPSGSGAGYVNLGIRVCQDIKIVNVAAFISLDGTDGRIQAARIAMGCVGPTCFRADAAENGLIGEKPGPATFAKAGLAAMQACAPRGSATSRASAEYKKDMVGVLTREALALAFKDALEH
jgi:CO/xanthine dehydrogenase FAD-binding subunit